MYLNCSSQAIEIFFTPEVLAYLRLGTSLHILLIPRYRVSIVVFSAGTYWVTQRIDDTLLSEKAERLSSAFSGDDLSMESRNDEAQQCWDIFKQNPIMGIGVGYRYRFWRHWGWVGANTYLINNFTHSDFMWFLSKTGIIGTILFLVFMAQMSRISWALWKKGSRPEDRAGGMIAFILIVGALIVGQSTPIFQTRGESIFLGVIMGYAFSLYRLSFQEREQNQESQPPVERGPAAFTMNPWVRSRLGAPVSALPGRHREDY